MGKGDRKTKRGKIILGSYGVTRPHKSTKAAVKPAAKTEVKPEKPEKPVKETTKKVKAAKPKKAAEETTE